MLVTRTGGFRIGMRRGWSAWQKDTPQLISWAKENGLSVIDLSSDATEHLQEFIDAGIYVGSMDLKGWGDLISENASDRQKALDENKELFEKCQVYGVKNYFAVMLPKDSTKPRKENFGYMIDSLNPLSELLEQFGGRLVIEGWPGPGALCCTPEGYRAVISQTSEPIGVNYDPSHLIRMGIDPIRFLNEFKDRVYHVHGKDCEVISEDVYEYGTEQPATFREGFGFGGTSWRYTIPGHGLTAWNSVFQILNTNGYDGAVSIELEDMNFNGSDEGEKNGILYGAQFLASV
jgi:sugar phosphate isomerase/epimerase